MLQVRPAYPYQACLCALRTYMVRCTPLKTCTPPHKLSPMSAALSSHACLGPIPCRHVTHVDATGARTFGSLNSSLGARGVRLLFAGLSPKAGAVSYGAVFATYNYWGADSCASQLFAQNLRSPVGVSCWCWVTLSCACARACFRSLVDSDAPGLVVYTCSDMSFTPSRAQDSTHAHTHTHTQNTQVRKLLGAHGVRLRAGPEVVVADLGTAAAAAAFHHEQQRQQQQAGKPVRNMATTGQARVQAMLMPSLLPGMQQRRRQQQDLPLELEQQRVNLTVFCCACATLHVVHQAPRRPPRRPLRAHLMLLCAAP